MYFHASAEPLALYRILFLPNNFYNVCQYFAHCIFRQSCLQEWNYVILLLNILCNFRCQALNIPGMISFQSFFRDMLLILIHIYWSFERERERGRGRGIYIYAIRLQLIFRSQTVRAATSVWGFAFGSMHDKKDFTKNPKPLDSSTSKTMQLNEFFRQPQQ